LEGLIDQELLLVSSEAIEHISPNFRYMCIRENKSQKQRHGFLPFPKSEVIDS
jgi:hypothetical protein